jgi:hypothetical protein
MRHYANAEFWRCYESLPASIQRLADKIFDCFVKILAILPSTSRTLVAFVLLESVYATEHLP